MALRSLPHQAVLEVSSTILTKVCTTLPTKKQSSVKHLSLARTAWRIMGVELGIEKIRDMLYTTLLSMRCIEKLGVRLERMVVVITLMLGIL